MAFTRPGASAVPFSVSCRLDVETDTTASGNLYFSGVRASSSAIETGPIFAKSIEFFGAPDQPRSIMVTGSVQLDTGDCLGAVAANDGTAMGIRLLAGSCTIRESGSCSQAIP